MSEFDEIDQKLKSLGLTQYEVKTLKTLIALSASTAEEIHKQTDIPTPRIYDTIESLQKKGLVRTITGRPKKFEALNLEKGLQNFIKFKELEFQDELNKISSISDHVLSLLSDPVYQSQLVVKPDELIEAYSTLAEMQVKTIDLVNKAKKEVCIFTNVFYWFEHVEKALKNALERNVKIRVLMRMEDDLSISYANKLVSMGAKVKRIVEESVLARGTLIDNEQVIFVIWVSPIKQEKYVYRPHFSSNSGIIEIFSNNFEYLWEKSRNM